MESLQNQIQNKQPPGRERRLESHEESMLLHEEEYPLGYLIILALETGMRLGELLGMRWENINLKKSAVVLVETKNGERRVVPLSSKAKEVII